MTTNEAIIKYLANRAQGNKLIEAVKTIEESGFTATTDSTNGGKRMVFCKATGTRLYYNKTRNDFSVGSVTVPLNKTVSDKCDFENLLNKERTEDNSWRNDPWCKLHGRKQRLKWYKVDVERCVKNINREMEQFEWQVKKHQRDMLALAEELEKAQTELATFREKVGLSPKKKITNRDIVR